MTADPVLAARLLSLARLRPGPRASRFLVVQSFGEAPGKP